VFVLIPVNYGSNPLWSTLTAITVFSQKMFHFLSDLSAGTGSASGQNVGESAKPPQETAVKRGRGRPKKTVDGGNKSQHSAQDGNAVIIKCELLEEVTPQLNRKPRKQAVDDLNNASGNLETNNDDSSHLYGEAEIGHSGGGTVSKGRRGKRTLEATSVEGANPDNDNEDKGKRTKRKTYNETYDDEVVLAGSDESDDEVQAKKIVKPRTPAVGKKSTKKKTPEAEETAVEPTKVVKVGSNMECLL